MASNNEEYMVNKRAVFLRWWLISSLILVASFVCLKLGLLQEIYEKDASYLSLVTLVVFSFTNLLCGKSCWKLSGRKFAFADLKREEKLGWFASEICLVLGMAGTIVGFILMLSGFGNLDVTNIATIQGLLADLGKSMATALYTTIVGLTCGTLLKIQYFNLGIGIEKANNES